MKAWKKVFLLASGAVLLLFVALVFAIRRAFPPEKIKQILLIEISKRMSREVSLGEVSLGIFSGVALKDFRCSEKPNFGSGTFLECKNLRLKWSLLPLIQKRIEIGAISLDAPQIHVARFADAKTFNFSDLLNSFGGGEPKNPQAASPRENSLRVQVTKLKIVDGTFVFQDHSPQKIEASIGSLNLTIHARSLEKPIKINLSARVNAHFPAQGISVNGESEFKGVVNFLL